MKVYTIIRDEYDDRDIDLLVEIEKANKALDSFKRPIKNCGCKRPCDTCLKLKVWKRKVYRQCADIINN